MAAQHQGPAAAIDAALSKYDADLKVLQVRYEQYFLGLERREPADDRAALRRAVMELKRENIRNTGLKFRLNSLWNKLLSYERMWDRTVKEIEEGRYRRDVFKAKLRGFTEPRPKAKKEGPLAESAPAGRPSTSEADGNGAGVPAAQAPSSSRAVPSADKRTSAGGAGPQPGLSNDKIDRLYQAFVMARRKCNEDTAAISRDGLERSLRRQLPALQEKHKGKAVDFKVVIRDGKAMLKAVPK